MVVCETQNGLRVNVNIPNRWLYDDHGIIGHYILCSDTTFGSCPFSFDCLLLINSSSELPT